MTLIYNVTWFFIMITIHTNVKLVVKVMISSTVRKHMSVHIVEKHSTSHTTNAPNRRYRCDFCNKDCSRVTTLKHHMLRHIGGPNMSCKQCGKEFMYNSHLQRHMVFHNDPKPHKCQHCGKGFPTPSTVRTHMSVHTGEKTPVECDICCKVLENNGNLLRHKEKIHVKMTLKIHPVTNNETASQHSQRDKKAEHSEYENEHDISRKLPNLPFVCQLCGKGYTMKSYFDKHKILHSGANPLTCNICQKQFIRRCNLEEHLFVHFSKDRNTCTVCHKAFKFASILRVHTGLDAIKSVFGGLRTTQAQTSLRICAV